MGDVVRHFCASVLVINPEDKKILLVRHKKFGKWVQPGGHIEENEFPEEAALREVFEETGIKVQLIGDRFPREDDFIRPLAVQRNRSKQGHIHIDFFYHANPVGSIEPIINLAESTDIGWFSLDEVLEMEDVFDDIKISFDYLIRTYYNK